MKSTKSVRLKVWNGIVKEDSIEANAECKAILRENISDITWDKVWPNVAHSIRRVIVTQKEAE